jgi:hypothetical protein
MINLTVDDRVIQAPDGSSVLSACLAAGITIPHLCWLEADTPADAPAACRLCFVEIDGFREPVTACTVTVENGMTVHTGTEAVRDLQKTALKLLLSVHRVDASTARPTRPAHCRIWPNFSVSVWAASPSNGCSRSRRWTSGTRFWTTTPTGVCCAASVCGPAGNGTNRPC